MGVCCKNRFPCPHSAENLASYGSRRIHESCQGGYCSRSCSPAKSRPALWDPKPGPYTPRQTSPVRPQTAPTSSSLSTSYQPYQQERPTSAQSNRSNLSYESCQYSNCSRSPSLTPRKFDEPVYPFEPKRPISPPGWTYSPKRLTRRGGWWDKDWKIAERSNHYSDPNLQSCGCPKTKLHAGSRTPSPPRSPRAIGLQYHYNRLANEGSRNQRSTNPKRERLKTRRGGNEEDGDGFQGFGHTHQYQNWSCSSRSQSRSNTPKARVRSRSPSPPRSTGSASPRETAPVKQRPQTPRGLQIPVVNSHGHCHTYNAWSCTPSNRNTPGGQSPAISRDPTPPRSASPRSPGTTTVKVSYSPTPPDKEPFTQDLKPLSRTKDQATLDTSSAFPPPRLFVSHHCHHCHLYHPTCPTCPTCGHSHGHHGRTLFTLASAPATPSTNVAECRGHHHHYGHYHHPCHCLHHCHHH